MTTWLRRMIPLIASGWLLLIPGWALAAFQVTDGSVERNKSLLTAGPQGAALRFTSGLNIKLESAARLRLHKDVDLWLDASGKTTTEVFTLVEGRAEVLRAVVSGQRPKAVLVRTSRKLMGATKNGDMIVVAEPEHGVVASHRGEAMLSTGGSWSRLEAGQFATVSRAMPKIVLRDLPKAPRVELSQRLWISLHQPAKVGGFTWSKAPDDVRFQLSVSPLAPNADPTSTRAMARPVTSTQLPKETLALGPGEYQVRVQAVNSFGLAGPHSAPEHFKVVGIRTHSGARVDARGTVHLGMNQRAEFSHVEGLVMAYGGSSSWAPATASVPLYDQEPTTVHFRMPNGTDIVSARLEPRGVVADVFVGSKLAQWPGDTVEVVMHLRDESGAVNAEALEVTPLVTLGIEPLNVQWTRQGATLRASIPPQPGPGPWVIRAWVLDQHGVELGRDFLEVAEREQPKPAQPIAAKPHPRESSGAVASVP